MTKTNIYLLILLTFVLIFPVYAQTGYTPYQPYDYGQGAYQPYQPYDYSQGAYQPYQPYDYSQGAYQPYQPYNYSQRAYQPYSERESVLERQRRKWGEELQRNEILRQRSTPKNAGIQNMINITGCDKYWSWCRNRVKSTH